MTTGDKAPGLHTHRFFCKICSKPEYSTRYYFFLDLISFSRTHCQLNTLQQDKEECEALVQLPVASFVDMVYAFKQVNKSPVISQSSASIMVQ